MAKKLNKKMFPKKPTKKEIDYWTKRIGFEGADIKEVPEEIRDYIAIMLGI